ncbi:hypothetical protein HK104_009202 [Borealophlyctis nickersoniae]|nr:hypothetical protein HK104_009202 [Borealophlyctis nickersoniae]
MATLREKWTKFEEDRARALASMGEVARGPTLVSSWVTEELIDEVETVEVEAGPARKPPVPMVGERTASLDRRKEALVEGQLSSWGVEEEDLMDNPWLDAETPNSPHESWRYAPHKENDTDSAVDLASVQDLDLGSGGRDSEWGNVSGRSAAALGCDTTAASATENDATSTSSNESSAISPDLLDHLFDIGWSISL